MQLLEMVALAVEVAGDHECPFDHEKDDTSGLENELPPNEENSSAKLGRRMGSAYHSKARIPIKVQGKKMEAAYSPHHLIPGDESWPETALHKWVDDYEGHIKSDIGYRVNDLYNGVSLPANHGVSGWKNWPHQAEYAIQAMTCSVHHRQFHDRHPAYSEFVVKVCDKIAEKLENQIEKTDYPGCGDDECAGNKRKRKPYDPPVGLIARLEAVALNLEYYLTCPPRRWKFPIYTSRFALMYKTKILEDDARDELSQAYDTLHASR